MKLIVGMFIALTLPSYADTISDFATGTQGWTGLSADPYSLGTPAVLTGTPVYVAAGGNPAGHLELFDLDDNDTYFSAPAEYLGNRIHSLNRNISFSLYTDASPNYLGPTVVLKGGGLTLLYLLTTPPAVQNAWVAVNVPLGPNSKWHTGLASGPTALLSDFETVLGSLDSIWISAESHFGISETGGLDNVRLSDPTVGSPVPEPSAGMLTAAGSAAAFAFARRRPALRVMRHFLDALRQLQ